MRLILTGGSGFIGNNFIDLFFEKYPDGHLLNIDCLTYVSTNRKNELSKFKNYQFFQLNIENHSEMFQVFELFKPTHVVHMAAWTHVDNSLVGPSMKYFTNTNVQGTLNLLQRSLTNCVEKFLYVSTDEVYGSITTGSATENTILNPRNPYSATKAAGEHLVNAFHHSFGLNTVITRCSNNYGPYQHTEKFIPNSIQNLFNGNPITLYGNGNQIREWIHSLDHCAAIFKVLAEGVSGEVYNISGDTAITNRKLAKIICQQMNLNPEKYITHVTDRLGHDVRYSMDSTKIEALGFKPTINFASGLESTINWYVNKFTGE